MSLILFLGWHKLTKNNTFNYLKSKITVIIHYVFQDMEYLHSTPNVITPNVISSEYFMKLELHSVYDLSYFCVLDNSKCYLSTPFPHP